MNSIVDHGGDIMKSFLKIVFFICLCWSTSVCSMQSSNVHLLIIEGKQGPKALTSPIMPEKIQELEKGEAIALYKSGLNVITSSPYEYFKICFSELSQQQLGVIFSYFMSFLAERSGLQSISLISAGDSMTQAKKSSSSIDASSIHIDNKLTSEFIRSIWTGKEISWEMFLGNPLAKTIRSIDAKLNRPEFLSGQKEYIDLTELGSSERKFLMALYSLNLLKDSGKGHVTSMLARLEEFQDSLELFQSINPYHHYLSDTSITGLSFRDYTRFFNYESLIKLSTTLNIARSLFESGIDAACSIGQLTDNLREFINCFLAHKLNEKDKDLFTQFVDLKKDFPDFE
jgi:hypothetical protein